MKALCCVADWGVVCLHAAPRVRWCITYSACWNGCQDSCTEFNRIKAESSSSPSLREKQLRDLAMAYDCFMDLKNNIEEGMQVCDAVC